MVVVDDIVFVFGEGMGGWLDGRWGGCGVALEEKGFRGSRDVVVVRNRLVGIRVGVLSGGRIRGCDIDMGRPMCFLVLLVWLLSC